MDYNLIKPYIEKGLVEERSHPEYPSIRIFNYTQTCQFSGAWDDVTRQCRGLIMNVDTGEILARPFPKFFNYQEHIAKNWPIPNELPIITEKFDGSLGIMYTLDGKTCFATRGSFTSDQAIWATKWWRDNKGDEPYGNLVTHLFEIIYPENRIVVNYDFSGLVYLGSIDTQTGIPVMDQTMPVRSAKTIDANDLEALAKIDESNSEGYVVFYPKANMRLKIKHPEYVRLHKVITGVSEIGIWEMMKDGKSLAELCEKVPDEFFKWVGDVSRKLCMQFDLIAEEAERDFKEIMTASQVPVELGLVTRKDIALEFQKRKHPNILFSMLDKKPVGDTIWRMIRPHGRSQFKVDIDQ